MNNKLMQTILISKIISNDLVSKENLMYEPHLLNNHYELVFRPANDRSNQHLSLREKIYTVDCDYIWLELETDYIKIAYNKDNGKWFRIKKNETINKEGYSVRSTTMLAQIPIEYVVDYCENPLDENEGCPTVYINLTKNDKLPCKKMFLVLIGYLEEKRLPKYFDITDSQKEHEIFDFV